MFFKENKYKDFVIAVLVTFILGAISLKLINMLGDKGSLFLGKLLSLSMPFIYGIAIAYIFNPVVKVLERKLKTSRGIAIALTYAIFFGIIIVLCIYGIPNLIDSIKDLVVNSNSYIDSLQKFTSKIMDNEAFRNFTDTTGLLSNLESYISRIGNICVNLLENSFSSLSSISSQIYNIIFGLIISVYALIDKDRLVKGTQRLLEVSITKKNADTVIRFLKTYNEMVGAYIGIKSIDSLIIGVMAFILLSIVKSQYSVLLAIIVGCTNMIPYFGPFIGEIIGFIINVFVSPVKALIVFLVLLALQLFDGWYLDPKLVGNKVGLRPIWIIYAVLLGGGFFGVIGMLLASPTAATINVYYKKLMERRNDKEKE